MDEFKKFFRPYFSIISSFSSLEEEEESDTFEEEDGEDGDGEDGDGEDGEEEEKPRNFFESVSVDVQTEILSFLKPQVLLRVISRVNKWFHKIITKDSPVVFRKGITLEIATIRKLEDFFSSEKNTLDNLWRNCERIKIVYNPLVNENKFEMYPIILSFFKFVSSKNNGFLKSVSLSMNLFLYKFKFESLVDVFNKFPKLQDLEFTGHRISEFYSFHVMMAVLNKKIWTGLKRLNFRSPVATDIMQSSRKGSQTKSKCFKMYYEEKEKSFTGLECLNVCASHIANQFTEEELMNICTRNSTNLKEFKIGFTGDTNQIVRKLIILKELKNLETVNIMCMISVGKIRSLIVEDKKEKVDLIMMMIENKEKEIKQEKGIVEPFEKVKLLRVINSFGQIGRFLEVFPKVEKLHIYNSRLQRLPNNLEVVPELKELHYTQNSMLFVPMKYRRLWGKMRIQSVPSSIKSLKHLNDLILRFDQKNYVSFDLQCLKECIALRSIDLKKIKLSNKTSKLQGVLDLDAFVNLFKIKLDDCVIGGLKSTNSKNFRLRKIKLVDCIFKKERKSEGSISIQDLKNLKRVIAKNCSVTLGADLIKIKKEEPDVSQIGIDLKNLPDLEEINFEDSKFRTADLGKLLLSIHKCSKKVRFINFNGTKMKKVPDSLFIELKHLEELKLENNEIEFLNFKIISTYAETLKVLDINGNGVYDRIPSMKIIKEKFPFSFFLGLTSLHVGVGQKWFAFEKVIDLKNYFDIRFFRIYKPKYAVGSVLSLRYYSVTVNKSSCSNEIIHVESIRKSMVVEAYFTKNLNDFTNSPKNFHYKGNKSLIHTFSAGMKNKEYVWFTRREKSTVVEDVKILIDLEKELDKKYIRMPTKGSSYLHTFNSVVFQNK